MSPGGDARTDGGLHDVIARGFQNAIYELADTGARALPIAGVPDHVAGGVARLHAQYADTLLHAGATSSSTAAGPLFQRLSHSIEEVALGGVHGRSFGHLSSASAAAHHVSEALVGEAPRATGTVSDAVNRELVFLRRSLDAAWRDLGKPDAWEQLIA